MPKYYTGVGSRDTPPVICALMTELAKYLEGLEYILRSGGAGGADTAFEKGAHTLKEIYLPWPGFNGNKSPLYKITMRATKLASAVHPAWDKCGYGARMLHTRNVYQVLGFDIETPSDFLICWTKDGTATGGTATAIRLAEQHGVIVYNLYKDSVRDDLIKKMVDQKPFN